jgi:hypothetical protein
MAQGLDVGSEMISHHLSRIGKVSKLDKWVPHELNEKSNESPL